MKSLLQILLLATMLTASAVAAEGPVRHVVHFKFKKEATPEQIKSVVDGFAALKTKIDFVQNIDWGTNMSPEGLDKGFSHCWIVTFKNAKDRDAYIVHPAHQAYVATLKPVLEEAFVVDFI